MYKRGYVQGTFDLFHIGHLNLLKKAKAKCEYLIVGVVTDELNRKYKNVLPCIPWVDRAEIVRSIKYVDEVIQVGFENEDKLVIWEKCQYNCHFSGDDHSGWGELIDELHKRGAEVEFFPYTQKISSTQIKTELKNQGKQSVLEKRFFDEVKGKIVLYGAGAFGQHVYSLIQNSSNAELVLWVDKEYKSLQKKGWGVSSINELVNIEYDKIIIAIKNNKVVDEIKAELLNKGICANKIVCKEKTF